MTPTTNTDWFDHAACKGMTHLFFPPDWHETDIERANREIEAGRYCAACPVLQRCDEYSHTAGVGDAFIAGKSGSTRRRARRAAAAAAHQPTPITFRRSVDYDDQVVVDHYAELDALIKASRQGQLWEEAG